MSTVSSEIDVEVPVTTVYNQWTQFEDFPAFMSGIEQVVQRDDKTLHWNVDVAGVKREFDAVITEQIPDTRIAWKSTSGPTHAGVVTFHRLNDAETRIRLELEWSPEGFVETSGAILQIDNVQVKRDLEEFKRLIESRGFETGAWRGEVDAPGSV